MNAAAFRACIIFLLPPPDVLQQKLQAEQHKQLVDKSTGQPLFQPQINRSSAAHKRYTADLPVGDYLYALHHEVSDRRRVLAQRNRTSAQRERAPFVNPRSEAIIGRLKQRRFAQVFEFLDAQQEGALNLLNVVLGGSPRFSNLSAEIRKDVEGAALLKCHAEGLCPAPVTPSMLHDMRDRCSALVHAHSAATRTEGGGETSSEAVDMREFSQLMHEVVSQQRGVPRRYLLPDVHVRHEEEELTFRPAINGHSAELAQGRWREAGGPVYEQLHANAKVVEVRCSAGAVAIHAVHFASNAELQQQAGDQARRV